MSDAWMDRGACIGEEPELWFPAGEGREFTTQIDKAKRVCFACPVRAECLELALDEGRSGIWGGTTETDRKQIRRRRLYHAKKTVAA